jgi:two-component system, chemotaxis family, chemotaxis protein CheY
MLKGTDVEGGPPGPPRGTMPAQKSPAKKVLIVDDDSNIRWVLRTLCEMHGFYCVGEAENGVDVERICRRNDPDLVVLDYMMPLCDGRDTAETIRRIAPKARILAFSAVLESAPVWADGYLDKTRIGEIGDALDHLYADGLAHA